ncbi:cupin [Firmicutes bacterium CAG:631]|jgi:DNA-binding protein|nr:cupin [Firmicutes bacterium CAG:631]
MSIGEKIRHLRTICQLTQEELADRCDLTKGFISQLENDLNSPSISTLTDILHALGTNLKEFFADDEDEKIVFKEEDYFTTDNQTHSITWLVPNAQKNEMEPILLVLEPKSELTVDMPHEGQEFGYVLEGSIIVVLAKKQFEVKKGETFYYETNKPHYLKNTQNKKAKVIWVSSPPNF